MRHLFIKIILALILIPVSVYSQEDGRRVPKAKLHREGKIVQQQDSILVNDSVYDSSRDSLAVTDMRLVVPDSVLQDTVPVMKNKVWIPDSNRSVWLATLFPGAGQIYNRKYWKLPIVYGGFVACTYALTWNNRMYKDYSQAYLDIMDSDPRTNSYEDFLPPSYDVTNEAVINQLKSTFKNKKDYYRKYRDLSIFAFVGVYLISIIDAYVDAELSYFDISPDLSMGVSPAIINDNKSGHNAYGLQYVLRF